VISPANPATDDIHCFGFSGVETYLAFIRENLPVPLHLTAAPSLMVAPEDQSRGGRRDDAARIRDLQDALDDPRTLAVVATNGGAYLSRLLPHLDFAALSRRRRPLWAFGFSEISTLVNLVASYPQGRGVYWLCPNFLAWRVKPRSAARAAFGEFWRQLARITGTERDERGDAKALAQTPRVCPLQGAVVAGRPKSARVRLVGGCLSVLAAQLGGRPLRRVQPDGRWLALEDVNDPPFRLDRHLAAFKTAGWFERVAGVLVGDFHADGADTQGAVLKLLPYHLPRGRALPVVATRSFGHVWPMTPLLLNRPLKMEVRRRQVTLEGLPSDAR